MSEFVSLKNWPTVKVDYKVKPTQKHADDFFTIMDLCFQIAQQKNERFVWELHLHKGAPTAPVFGMKFIAWLVQKKANITQYIDYTNVYLGDQSTKKWIDLILSLYTPARPVHVKEMFDY